MLYVIVMTYILYGSILENIYFSVSYRFLKLKFLVFLYIKYFVLKLCEIFLLKKLCRHFVAIGL